MKRFLRRLEAEAWMLTTRLLAMAALRRYVSRDDVLLYLWRKENQMSIIERFRAWLDREAEASLDRGETPEQWLAKLRTLRDTVDEETAAARVCVRAEGEDV